ELPPLLLGARAYSLGARVRLPVPDPRGRRPHVGRRRPPGADDPARRGRAGRPRRRRARPARLSGASSRGPGAWRRFVDTRRGPPYPRGMRVPTTCAVGLRCIDCGAELPLEYRLSCARCPGLLEPVYDLDPLGRLGPGAAFSGRGVWRYHPVLPITDPAHFVSLGEG